jgi:hypothetical protein
MQYNKKPERGPPRLAHLTASEYVTCKHISPQQFASYFKFAIVRNPWDRMVSFYKYLGSHKCSDFKQFLMEHFSRQLWNYKYWFVRPQCEFIYGENDACLVNYVGRFEFLSMAMDYIGRQVGLQNVSLPHINRSSRKFQPDNSSVGDLCGYATAGYPKQEKKIRDDYRTYYDQDSILRVAELYKRDIEIFGYEFDPPPKGHAVETQVVK